MFIHLDLSCLAEIPTILKMSDDWNTVTVLRGKQAKPGAAKSSSAVNAARRRGEAVSTEMKYGAGGNKHTGTSLNTTKLDRETEELKHATVSMDVGKLIQKGRQAKVRIVAILKPSSIFRFCQIHFIPDYQLNIFSCRI